MQLSKRTQYGLRALICLADSYPRGYLQTREITARENLPTSFLAAILAALTRAKLLHSRIGPTGGYRLAMDPREIFVGDIVLRLEGKKMAPGKPESDAAHPSGEQGVRLVQNQVASAVLDVLNKMTLAELAEKAGARGRGQMYYI